nr:tlde1 domain-containing protein [Ancylobacter crimeensis]
MVGVGLVGGALLFGAAATGMVSFAAAPDPATQPRINTQQPAMVPPHVAVRDVPPVPSVSDIGNYRAVGIVSLPSGWLFSSALQVPVRVAAAPATPEPGSRPVAPFVSASLGPVSGDEPFDMQEADIPQPGASHLAVIPVPIPSPVVKTARTVPLPATNPLVAAGRLNANDTPDDPSAQERLAVAPPPRPDDLDAAAEPDNAPPKVAAATPADKPLPTGPLSSGLAEARIPGRGDRYALYDISAKTVYLPGGAKLEAHSGYGEMFDNPRYIHVKMRGPTPPNTYKLSMRESLFHGVEALRMTPVGDGKMYGRDGILSHTYMLGARGDSNGCVSFREYEKFLAAYKRGDVTQMVVVDRLQNPSAPTSNPLIAWLTGSRR